MSRHATNPSRYLTLLLRHKPEVAGISLNAEGWASTDAIVGAVRRKYGPFTKQDLHELVYTNDKQRFQLSGDAKLIRAVQGHSIAVELGLSPVQPPATLYHGTKAASLGGILKEGLKPLKRQHVHLSPGVPQAVQIARRRAGAGVILAVRTGLSKMPFYQAHNGVWLTLSVAPECLVVERWLETEPDE